MTKEKLFHSIAATTFRYILIITVLLVCRPLSAQHKLHITKVRSTAPVVVNKPLMVDSINLKKEKFENKKLLETTFLPAKQDYTEVLNADTSKLISFPASEGDENRLRCLSFSINTDRYAKLKVIVTTASMAELYINGKKESSKTTVEDSIGNSKNLEKEISMPTGTVEFAVKHLSLAKSKAANESLRIVIEAKDTAVNLALGGDKRHIRINDIMEGTRVAGAAISPNGRFVILSYTNTVEGGEVSRYSELYDVKTGQRRYLDKNLSGTPLSGKLYYTAQRGENNSLIFVDPETLAETVFAENIPKGNFRMTPDEKHLIYTVKESYDERKGDLLILKSPADRQEGYLDRNFIYSYSIADKVNRQLTFGSHTTSINDISRDSRYLLFSTTDEHITERPFRKSSMFILDMQTLKIDTLWTDQKYAQYANFSPDGKKILVSGGPEAFDGIGLNVPEGMTANSYDTQAFIVDREGKVEAISKNFNPCISRMSWHTNDDIYLSVEDADYQKIYKYSLSKKTYTELKLLEEVTGNFNAAINANTAVYVGSSASNYGRAYLYDIKTGNSTLISDPAKDRLGDISLGAVRDWDFKASDGTTIKGRYYLPPNFDASRKYPMIVYYYGGTAPTQRVLVHSYPLHVYASMGYVVYTLQPSGTTGFGQEFSARHVNAWGKRTADEIIEGTKRFAAEHQFVDEKKIGCVGASYGGFMTMYLQTVTDIFAAAVSHAGISALASYWGEGYWGYAYSGAASAGSYPWNNRELYIEQSPLYNADKIKTPLLLLHGMEDTNVPPGESIQMYTALKILGKPVEFIRVKGENHGIATYKKRLEWNYSIYAWFAKWLKDDSSWWDSMYK